MALISNNADLLDEIAYFLEDVASSENVPGAFRIKARRYSFELRELVTEANAPTKLIDDDEEEE